MAYYLVKKQSHKKCGSEVRLYQRNDHRKVRKVFRRKKKGCQTTLSVHDDNSFFTYMDANGRKNSGLSEFMEIVCFWVTDNKLVQIIKCMRRSKNTICDRDLLVCLFNKGQPFGGPGLIVQIVECLLQGSRKNNKGHIRLADLKTAFISRRLDKKMKKTLITIMIGE